MKKIILTGNVGRDPVLKSTLNGGQHFVTFSVGVSVGTKENPKTDWIDVNCNGKLADVVLAHVKKCSKLLIEGIPSVNAYINSQNQAVATMRVMANSIEFIGAKIEQDNSSNANSHYVLESDNIPF